MEHTNGIPATVAEIELSYKTTIKPSQRICVDGASKANQIFRQYWNLAHMDLLESFKLLLLNSQCQVLGDKGFSK